MIRVSDCPLTEEQLLDIEPTIITNVVMLKDIRHKHPNCMSQITLNEKTNWIQHY